MYSFLILAISRELCFQPFFFPAGLEIEEYQHNDRETDCKPAMYQEGPSEGDQYPAEVHRVAHEPIGTCFNQHALLFRVGNRG